MNMKFKKLAACLMATASLVTGMVGISASASDMPNDPKNYGDTNITDFSVPPDSQDWRKYTGSYSMRNKNDDSEVYFHATKGSVTLSLRTYGCTNNSWGTNLTMNASGNFVDYVCCRIGTEYAVKNYIYERKNSNGYRMYPKAGLEFKTTSSYMGTTITGVWSPDSYMTSSMSYAN